MACARWEHYVNICLSPQRSRQAWLGPIRGEDKAVRLWTLTGSPRELDEGRGD